jgi:uncharacterized protein
MMTLRAPFSAALVGLALVAPVGKAAQAEDLALRLATGGVAGVYYPLGEALAMVWSETVDGVSVEAEPTGGSVANVALVHEGEAQLAFVQNDIASYAAEATEMFEGRDPLDGYLGLAMLYPEPVQIVALADSGLSAVADLEGERVAVGAWGSGTEVNARQILEAHGLTYDDIYPVFMPFDEAAAALGDGLIQAAFLTAGVPTAAVTNLIDTYRFPSMIVPLTPEQVEAITERWPYYAPATIPGGAYPGIEADTGRSPSSPCSSPGTISIPRRSRCFSSACSPRTRSGGCAASMPAGATSPGECERRDADPPPSRRRALLRAGPVGRGSRRAGAEAR